MAARSCAGPGMTADELLDLICLTMVPGVGPNTCRALLERFGTAAARSRRAWRRSGGAGVGGQARREDRAGAPRPRPGGRTGALPAGERPGHRAATPPIRPRSRTSPTLPRLLYIAGRLEPRDQLAIAIVGSRRCTPYGLRIAEKLAAALARVGLTVVSGLARGSTPRRTAAPSRRGAGRSPSWPTALSQVYPPEHENLAREVADSGAVLSEMPMRQAPLAGLFPQRNRIISGLSLGVVVVEATPRSGSLSTARHAMEQNREVFAVPGPVDSLPSQGCHRLIRDGARLVETVDDILEELGPLVREVRPLRRRAAGPAPGRADPHRPRAIAPGPALRPSRRRRRADRPHRPDRRAGHGHAQRPRDAAAGPPAAGAPVHPAVKSCLMFDQVETRTRAPIGFASESLTARASCCPARPSGRNMERQGWTREPSRDDQ